MAADHPRDHLGQPKEVAVAEPNAPDCLALLYPPDASLRTDFAEIGWTALPMGEHLEALLLGRSDLWVLDLEAIPGDPLLLVRALSHLREPAPLLLVATDEYISRHAAELTSALEDWPVMAEFLVRPYVLARLQLRLRQTQLHHPRAHGGEAPLVEVGGLRLDPGRRQVHFAGQMVALSPTEFRILQALTEAQGRVVPKATLQHLASESATSSGGGMIEVHVSRLRRKLAEAGMASTALRTARNAGYALDCQLLQHGRVED